MHVASTTGDFGRYYPSRSVAAPLEDMAAAGYRYVDLSFYRVIYPGSPWTKPGEDWKKEIYDAGEKAAKLGLTFLQAHSPDGEHFVPGEARDALYQASFHCLEACQMLSIPHTVMHAGSTPGKRPEEFREINGRFYRDFADAAEKAGVDMLTENTSAVWNPAYFAFTGEDMRLLVEAAGVPRLHILWDTGHANCEGRDQYHDILAMGSELRGVHIQDNFGNADSHLMPLVGTTDFDAVVRGLIDIGYQGNFVLEGDNALRNDGSWPHYRKHLFPEESRLGTIPKELMLAQESVMRRIAEWMLEQYGLLEK